MKMMECNCDTPKHDVRVWTDTNRGIRWVQCDWCGTCTAEYDTGQEAIEAWNKQWNN